MDDDTRQRGPPRGRLRQYLTSPGRCLTPPSVMSNVNVKCRSGHMLQPIVHAATQEGVDRS